MKRERVSLDPVISVEWLLSYRKIYQMKNSTTSPPPAPPRFQPLCTSRISGRHLAAVLSPNLIGGFSAETASNNEVGIGVAVMAPRKRLKLFKLGV